MVIRDFSHGQKAFVLEPFDTRVIGIIAPGSRLQALPCELAEVLAKRSRGQDFFQGFAIAIDGRANAIQPGSRRHIGSAGNQGGAGFNMDIIARPIMDFFGEDPEMGAEMGLVGRLVLGEAHVAMDSENALRHIDVLHRRIEGGNAQGNPLDEVAELFARGRVAVLVRLEPGSVIVLGQCRQELESLGGYHVRKVDFSKKEST